MFQSLLRNWLMGTARQTLQEAAANAARGAQPASGTETEAPQAERTAPCHVGLVFALGMEAGGLIDRLSGVILTEGSGFVAREGGLQGRRLVVIESGAGCAAAARATRALILGHRPRWIISAGFAGGLDDRLAQGDILMADQIVDANGRCFEIDFRFHDDGLDARRHVHVGRLLTTDTIVRDPQVKRDLGRRHGAMAVDMESVAVAEVCRDEKVRLLSVRVITDSIDRTLPPDLDFLIVRKKTAAGRLGAAAGAILRRPSSFKEMWQLKEDALVASERLARFLIGVIGQL